MKIRIKGNSIRVRLSRSEVAAFANDGYLEDTTDFGSSALVYAMQRADIPALTATFVNGKITVHVPGATAQAWTGTDMVGFSNDAETGKGTLFVLVEKDFQCIDNTLEDQSDNYINPNKAC